MIVLETPTFPFRRAAPFGAFAIPARVRVRNVLCAESVRPILARVLAETVR